LSPTTTANVVTYQVIVNAPNQNLKLKPGLTANITVYTVEKSDVQTLPNKVFSFKPNIETLKTIKFNFSEDKEISRKLKENERIIWVQEGQTIRNKKVVIGDVDTTNTEIISGLTTSETVVLDQKSLADDTSNTSTEKSPFMPSLKGKKGQAGAKK